ncbi:MAG TPA: NUDIX hydrolase [Actinomycetaceae bacterium]|nr:NUDIX hydrolase [Actinomycetaceae bacterium]
MRPRDRKDDSRSIVSARTIHTGHVFDLRGEDVALRPGEVVSREFVDHPGAVAVLPLRQPGGPGSEEILLLDQYRHPVRAVLWEVPAGLLDVDGEDPLAAAQRELAEEADVRAMQWHVLADFFTTPGGSNESLRVYLARDLSDVPPAQRHQRTHEERDMTPQWFVLDDAIAAVHAGELHNPSTVVAVLAAASARARHWSVLRPADAPWMR